MAYEAKNAQELRRERGSLLTKIASENSLIEAGIDTASKECVVITAGMGTTSALATAGVDLADGSGGTTYGVFVAPVALTLTNMYVSMTEAYVKKTTDAVIAVKDGATTPVTRFTTTLDDEGVDAGDLITVTPEEDAAAMAAGDRLDLVITSTVADTGTGHAIIILEYTR